MRYKIHDYVMYPKQGVFEITGIEEITFQGSPKQYYVLEQLYKSNSTIKLPVDMEHKLRKTATKEEVNKVLTSIKENNNESLTKLTDDKIESIMNQGDIAHLFALMDALYESNKKRVEAKRTRSYRISQKYRTVKELVCQEVAFSMNLSSPEFAEAYIRTQLSN